MPELLPDGVARTGREQEDAQRRTGRRGLRSTLRAGGCGGGQQQRQREGERLQRPSRWTTVALRCAVGITTMSKMLTFGGRATTHAIHSAMSSALSGSNPS